MSDKRKHKGYGYYTVNLAGRDIAISSYFVRFFAIPDPKFGLNGITI